MNSLSSSESQELEKCFFEMQGICQIEIKNIADILQLSRTTILLNKDFNTTLSEATNNMTLAISSAIRIYLLILVEHDNPQELTLPLNNPVILYLAREEFIDDLVKEIQSLSRSMVLAKSGSSVLHPTIFIPLHMLIKAIQEIRPSTLFSLAYEALIRLNRQHDKVPKLH